MTTTEMRTSVFQGKLQIYVFQLCLEIPRGLNLTVGLTHSLSPKSSEARLDANYSHPYQIIEYMGIVSGIFGN